MLDPHLTKDKLMHWSHAEVEGFLGSQHQLNMAFWEWRNKRPTSDALPTLIEYVGSQVAAAQVTGIENRNWKFIGGLFEDGIDTDTQSAAIREAREELGWQLRQRDLELEIEVTSDNYREVYYVVQNNLQGLLDLRLDERTRLNEIMEFRWVSIQKLLQSQEARKSYEGISGDEWTAGLKEVAKFAGGTMSRPASAIFAEAANFEKLSLTRGSD